MEFLNLYTTKNSFQDIFCETKIHRYRNKNSRTPPNPTDFLRQESALEFDIYIQYMA